MGGYHVGYAQGDEFMSILTRLAVMVRSRAVEAYDDGRVGRSPENVGAGVKPSAVLSTLTSWPDPSKCAIRATAPALRRSNGGRLRDMGELLGTVRDHPLTVSKLLPILQRVEADATGMDGDPDRLRMPRFLSHVFSRMLVGLVSSHDEDGGIPVRCAFNNLLLDKWSDTTLAAFSERLDNGSVTIPDGFLESMLSCQVAEGMERILSMGHIPVFPDFPLLLTGGDPADSIGELVGLERRMRTITDTMNVSDDVEMLPLTMGTMRGLVSNPPPMPAWKRAATIMRSRLLELDYEYEIALQGYISHYEDRHTLMSRHEHDAEHTFAAMVMSDWGKAPEADTILDMVSAFVPKTSGDTAEKLRVRVARLLDLHKAASVAYTVDDVALESGDRDLIPAVTMAYVLIRAAIDGGVKRLTFDEAMVRDLVESCGGWNLPYGYVSETAAYIVRRRMDERGAAADPRKAAHSGEVCFNDDKERMVSVFFDWGTTGSGAVDGH